VGSGMLPDAPANTLVIDAPASTIYVGTDVGVFSSSTGTANWTEVGPVSAANRTGFLPNVPVTKLRVFRGGGQVLLRAATYGRGLWEYPLVVTPDYLIAIASPSTTIYPGDSASFSGSLRALSAYSSVVDLSCTKGTMPPPVNCNISPAKVQPSGGTGTAFSLTASDAIGDYVFNVHGIGTDANSMTHDQTVTLRVVDFGLDVPSPTAVTANRPNASNTTTFQVNGYGSFNTPITLTCAGLPAGASCNFSPASVVSPLAGNPAIVNLSIGTSSTTPAGNSVVTITATSGSVTRSRTLNLTVTTLADYTVAMTNASQSALVNVPATFTGTLTALNGYSSGVNLSCGPGAPAVCTVAPSTSVTPSAAGAAFTVTVSSLTSQSYSFSILANGTDPLHLSHSASVVFRGMPDFSFSAASVSATVNAGSTAQYNLDFVPRCTQCPAQGSDTVFTADITYACSTGLPSFATCSFNPPQIAAGSTATGVLLTIATRAPGASAKGHSLPTLYFAFIQVAAISVLGLRLDRSPGRVRRTVQRFLFAIVLLCIGVLVSCAGGGSGSASPPELPKPGTPGGTYSITINASEGSGSASVQHSLTLNLTVQ
jgi:hypothetical protein